MATRGHLTPRQDPQPRPRIAQKQKAWLLASSHTHQGKLKLAAVTAKLVSTREGVRVEGGARAAGGRVDNDALQPKQKRKTSKWKHVITLTFCCI